MLVWIWPSVGRTVCFPDVPFPIGTSDGAGSVQRRGNQTAQSESSAIDLHTKIQDWQIPTSRSEDLCWSERRRRLSQRDAPQTVSAFEGCQNVRAFPKQISLSLCMGRAPPCINHGAQRRCQTMAFVNEDNRVRNRGLVTLIAAGGVCGNMQPHGLPFRILKCKNLLLRRPPLHSLCLGRSDGGLRMEIDESERSSLGRRFPKSLRDQQ